MTVLEQSQKHTTALFVDSSCDVPGEILKRHNVQVIPSVLTIKGQNIIDDKNDDLKALDLMRRYDFKSQATAYRIQSDENLFRQLSNRLNTQGTVAGLVITATRLQAENYHTVNELSHRVTQQSNRRLQMVGSRTLYSAEGLLVLYAARLNAKGLAPVQLRKKLVQLSNHLYCYTIPKNLGYVRKRGKERGEKTAPWAIAALSDATRMSALVQFHQDQTRRIGNLQNSQRSALALLVEKLRELIASKALLIPQVIFSYGGSLTDVADWPEMQELSSLCREQDVQLIQTTMSIGGLYHIGPGSITLGMAARAHNWES